MTTAWAQPERPDWLKDDDPNASSTPNTSDSGRKDDLEANSNRDMAVNTGTNNMQPDNDDKAPPGRCKGYSITTVSIIFLAGFAYSAFVNLNATEMIWAIFYIAHGVVPFLFLTHYYCCFPPAAIYSLASSLFVWAIVFIILQTLQVVKHIEDGDKLGKDDGYRTDVYELGGASISAFSALYHMMLVRCCIGGASAKKQQDEVETDNV